MNRIIAYATSDLHWPETEDRGPWASEPLLAGETTRALEQVVQICVQDQADLIIAGDIFDGPDPTPESLARLYRTLRPLAEAGRSLYYILGNHDRGRDWLLPAGIFTCRLPCSMVTSWPGVRDLMISGTDYQDPAVFLDHVGKSWIGNLAVYHQAFQEFCGGGRGIPLSRLPSSDLAICGDTHVPMLYVLPPGATGPKLALSPGPLVPQSTGEFGFMPRIWAIRQDLTVRPRYLALRSFYRFDITSPDEADRVLAQIARLNPAQDRPRPFVAVQVAVEIPGLRETLRQLVEDKDFILRLSTRRKDVATPERPAPSGGTLSSAIATWPTDPCIKSLALAATAPGADPLKVFADDAQTPVAGPV